MRKFGMLLTLLTLTVLRAGEVKSLEITDFIQETQKIEIEEERSTVIWWIPPEFWELIQENDPSLTAEQARELIAVFDGYLILAIVDVQIGSFGSVNSPSREDIVQNISVKDSKGTKLYPLRESQLSDDLKQFLDILKPHMEKFLGQFGQSLELIVFSDQDNEGRRIFEPRNQGSLTVEYNLNTYMWRLPLGSLLPPKYDRQTGEAFPGNYNYNPFTGDNLSPR